MIRSPKTEFTIRRCQRCESLTIFSTFQYVLLLFRNCSFQAHDRQTLELMATGLSSVDA